MTNRLSVFSFIVAVLAVAGVTSPGSAAEPIYPPGVRVGMTPLVGLVAAKAFAGFETSDQSVRVLVTELPAAAYDEVETASKSGAANSAGAAPESLATAAGRAFYTTETARDATGNVRRYSMILPGGTFSGYVAMQVPENATRIYTDDAVRQMFSSAAIRKEIPVAEQLGLMPFTMSEMSGFKTIRTLAPGAALLLADITDETKIEASTFMVVGTIGSVPETSEDRSRFAEQAASRIPGLRESRITMSEPLRLNSMPAYETRIDGVSGKDNTPVSVVQWLRFGANNLAVRILASAPRTEWSTAFPRFRTVRDGIDWK